MRGMWHGAALKTSGCSCGVNQHATRKGRRTRTGKTGEGMEVSHNLKSGLTSSLLARSSTAASSLQHTRCNHASGKTDFWPPAGHGGPITPVLDNPGGAFMAASPPACLVSAGRQRPSTGSGT